MYLDKKSVCLVLVCLCSFAIARYTRLTRGQMRVGWVAGVGWRVTCSFHIAGGDSLLSYVLYRDNRELFRYTKQEEYDTFPWKQHEVIAYPDDDMELTCEDRFNQCQLVIKPKRPPTSDINIKCDVMGEKPRYSLDTQLAYQLQYVLPSDAVMEISKITDDSNPVLNCSATGIPAPKIEWTVGANRTKVDGFRSSSAWNNTLKTWESWSTFVPTEDQLPARCTAKLLKRGTMHASKERVYPCQPRLYVTGRGLETFCEN